jgi:hypothetical protein
MAKKSRPSASAKQPTTSLLPAFIPADEVVEFQPVGETAAWRVEAFALLSAEFGLTQGDLPPFVLYCQQHPRLWLLARRLYGIAPVIPSPDTDPGDLRVWKRAELEEEGFSVTADLEALRGFWSAHRKRETPPETAAAETPVLAVATSELPRDEKLLEQFNFSERLFRISVYDPLANGKGGVVPRSEKENRAERDWFIGRVTEWAKMLADSIAGPLARSALMNEMTMRRLESEIAVADPKQRATLYEQKSREINEYKTAIAELQQMFPEIAVAGKVSFRAVVSDLIVANRDYYANADRQLVDKVFTVTEIEFLTRSSEQLEARYRFSLNLAIVDCINGLYDPNFRPRFKPRVLKLIDAGFRAGMEAVRAAQPEKLVDLENGVLPGEGDEFEDFNDAECPHCGGRISSQAKRCPECRKAIRTDPNAETNAANA